MHPTPISAAVFLFASGGSACLLCSRIGLPKNKVVRTLAGFVLWEAVQLISVQLLATLQILGWITRVTVPALAGVQGVTFAGVAIWCRLRKESVPVAAGANSHHDEPLPAYIFVAAAVLLASYLAFAANVFTSFPSGSDALIYHLPLALRWLQDGSLSLPASRAWRYCMPGNAEINMMILLSSGRQSTVAMASWIPAVMLTLSTYLFSTWISKGNRLASITASLIVLSLPMIEWQIFSAYVDLLGTAGIVAAFALMLSENHRKAPNNLTLLTSPPLCFVAGLACGVSVGTKPIYYFFAAVFSAFMVCVFWGERKRGAKTLLKFAVLVGCGMLLPSSFWFARALKQTGNPVYPIQVKAGRRVLLAGYPASQLADFHDFELSFVRRRREWLVYPWTEWRRSPGYLKVTYSEGGGVGAVFATFVPLGVLFFFLRAWGRPELRGYWIVLLLFTGLVASWWTLMERVLRYGESILIFACVLSVPLVAMLHAHARRAFASLVIGSMIATSAICASAPAHMLAGRLRKHRWSRAQIYGYPKLIDELPSGSVVLNASGISEKNFAIAGKRLTNHVIADFEAPPELTVNSLHASAADYVAEVVPGNKYSEASLVGSGATVIDDELVPTGEVKVRWRIWKVEKKNDKPDSLINSQ